MAGHGDIPEVNDLRGWSPDVQATFCATLVDEWVRCGLTDAVVCPGSRSTPMTLALAADDRLAACTSTTTSGQGRSSPSGLASASGRPVVIVTTSGTAVVELHPAVVEADLAGVPLIVCTADRPPELRDVAAPQTVDQTHLFGRAVALVLRPRVSPIHRRPAHGGRWRRERGPRPLPSGRARCSSTFRSVSRWSAAPAPLPPARGDSAVASSPAGVPVGPGPRRRPGVGPWRGDRRSWDDRSRRGRRAGRPTSGGRCSPTRSRAVPGRRRSTRSTPCCAPGSPTGCAPTS